MCTRRFVEYIQACPVQPLSIEPRRFLRSPQNVYRLRQPYRSCLMDPRASSKRILWDSVILYRHHIPVRLDSPPSQHPSLLGSKTPLVHQTTHVAQVGLALSGIAGPRDGRLQCLGSIPAIQTTCDSNERTGGDTKMGYGASLLRCHGRVRRGLG
jgi:hypothetical protein